MEARMERCLKGLGRLLGDSLTHIGVQSRSTMSASRMPCTRCRTTRSRPQSSPRRRSQKKHSPSNLHQRPRAVLPMRPWRQLLKHVNGKKRRGASASKSAKKPQRPTQSSTAPSRIFLEKAEALEKDVRTVTMRAESLATMEAEFKKLLDRQEEAQRHLNELSAQLHRHPVATVKIAPRRKRKGKKDKHTRSLEYAKCPSVCWSPPPSSASRSRIEAQHLRHFQEQRASRQAEQQKIHDIFVIRLSNFLFIVSGEPESEELWFDVRPKGVGKRRSCPIHELCSDSSAASTMAAQTFKTRVASSQPTHGRAASACRPKRLSPHKLSTDGTRTFGCRPDARSRKFTAALVPSVEAWAVTVSLGTQETPVMLKAVLLAASTSESELE